jgi:hypothetical protein
MLQKNFVQKQQKCELKLMLNRQKLTQLKQKLKKLQQKVTQKLKN